ncbi:MAG: type II toxin-antitoxin system HicB family antitoxin [Alphaproteobacteria bacterium]|nr:type II toxin-antitoxin system HicB family antitoxin [Alphaproteobacteria bacterium]
MMLHDKYDGFTVTLSLDEEDDWIAHFEELPNVSAFSSTPEDALKELEIAWEAMKESYRKHGEPIPISPAKKDYSGHFNVRVDKRVHCALAVEAAQVGLSLNALVAQKLAQSVKASHRIHHKT